jgi:hypothetical protein
MPEISSARSLHRLIYASECRLEGDWLEDAVAQIIETSVRNNRRVGVTGLLLVHAGWFIQALEGPAEAVMTTYGRILNDRRHHQPSVLSAGPVGQRAFGDWHMCARTLTPADDAILDTLNQRSVFDPVKLNPDAALRLLVTVSGIKARAEREAIA